MKFPLPLTFFCIAILFSCQEKQDTLFQRVSHPQTGITFKNALRESEAFNVMKYSYFYNGGGVAVGDINNDGRLDIYFTGNMVASHLYLNKGDWHFENIAKKAGVEASGLWNTGVTMADVNGDGWLDIYISRSAAVDPDARRNLLFINTTKNSSGPISFTEEGAAYGLDDPAYSTHAAFFDFDRDGDLDMYLLNHSLPQYSNFNSGLRRLKSRNNSDFGDKLYRNDGGTFTDVTKPAGIKSNVLGFGLGIAISDLNNDQWPDIYVSNDFNEEDYLYINQGDGTFLEQLANSMDHTSLFSMGSDAADINNDGATDVVTLDMLPKGNYREKLTSGSDNFDKYRLLLDQGFHPQIMRNMLQVNSGNGQFREVGQLSGISNTDWSWSALIADYDLDGWQDLFVTNGYLRDYTNMDFLSYAVDMKSDNPNMGSDEDIQDLLKQMPKIEVANQIFKNLGGTTFEDQSTSWGFDKIELSNGAVYGDLDNDGDLDLVINNVNDFAGIYRNTAVEKKMGNYLKINLTTADATTCIGSKVRIHADTFTLQRELFLSRGYQSSVEPTIFFGLGQQDVIDSLEVYWPDGLMERFEGSAVNITRTLEKGQGRLLGDRATSVEPYFKKVDKTFYRHVENNFNDFRRQSLLPKFYSRSGPILKSADLNGNGHEDLICAGAAGQATAIFTGLSDGRYTISAQSAFDEDARYEDVDFGIGDVDGDGDSDIVIASGGNASSDGDEKYTCRLYLNNGNGIYTRHQDFPKVITNAQCLDLNDYDGDGDLDIFVGSAFKAQKYPLPDENYLLLNDGKGHFTNTPNLPFANHRTTAVTSADYDVDGHIELIIVGEYERMEIWTLESSTWTLERSSACKGLWTSVTCDNFDDDPALEIIVGNHGLNSQWNASPTQPMVLYSGDFDQNNTIDPILTKYYDGESFPFVSRDDLVGQLPHLKKYFTSYKDYASFSTMDLLDKLTDYNTDTVQSLQSTMFDLREDHFTELALPEAAQISPLYVIHPIDFDLDGDLDIILAGNQLYNRVKLGEIDANHGILLRNEGNLQWTEVPAQASGLSLKGEVRSCVKIKISDDDYFLFGVNDSEIIAYKVSK